MINHMPFNRNKFRLTWCLRSNWQTGSSSGTKFLDMGRTVFENGITVVVLEICLSEKALVEVEFNLETVDNGGKSVLLNTKERTIYTI